jgi:phosphoribosylformylglycinamidine cyclo-ligase
MGKFVTYEQAGVNIDANDLMVRKIQSALASTFGPRVIESSNSFAGLFRLDYDEKLFKKNYTSAVLVACADGVGSKVQLAARDGRYDTVGIDLVAMNVNDMLTVGAEPLFFLDYLAVHKLEPEKITQLVKGIAAGCRLADCSLIGGETAEMPDTYKKGDFDMAGFAVGVVERRRIINGDNICSGDQILGLASNGLHSNGYSLARTICFKQASMKTGDRPAQLNGKTLGSALLEPTRIYSKSIVKLLAGYKVKKVVHGMAHITGGGLAGNIPRVLPGNCDAVIYRSKWPKPAIFDLLQEAGPVAEAEMYRVFNMGIGFVLITAPDFANSIAAKLTRYGEKVYRIGYVGPGSGRVILKEGEEAQKQRSKEAKQG